MMASCRLNIPAGKFRVVSHSLHDHSNLIIKDCDSEDEAFQLADKHNCHRIKSESNVYYVYDDKGRYRRGPEATKDLKDETVVRAST